LLRENLDLKDYLEENNLNLHDNCIDLKDLYSVFGNDKAEDIEEDDDLDE
jgi:hypothetical protein